MLGASGVGEGRRATEGRPYDEGRRVDPKFRTPNS